jgi:hypothetical protein
MCETFHADRDQSIMRRANQYLLDEARDRPTVELTDLLLEAAHTERSDYCHGNFAEIRRASRLLDAVDSVEDRLRGGNRFLDRGK